MPSRRPKAEPSADPAAAELVRVYPSPALAERREYLAGVGSDGADVAPELAAEWIAAGLAVLERPAAAPDLEA